MIGPSAAAGVFLAVSMYFRAAIEFTIVTLGAPAIVLGLFFLFEAWVGRQRSIERDRGVRALLWRGILLPIAAALTFFVLAAGPYWIAHHGKWIDTTTSMAWDLVWKTPAEVPPELQYFVEDGGAAGCVVDPPTCEYVHNELRKNAAAFTHRDFFNLTVGAALHHPVAWLRYKLGVHRQRLV